MRGRLIVVSRIQKSNRIEAITLTAKTEHKTVEEDFLKCDPIQCVSD